MDLTAVPEDKSVVEKLIKREFFQAIFNVVMLPYTLKLLWAPLVDSFYVKKIGRRKSWLIPIQFLMGKYNIFYYPINNSLINNQEV